MALTVRTDEMVKEYLLYRGFTSSLKAIENDIRTEKERGFQVDKIMELFHGYIASYDIYNLREFWCFLDRRLFSRLEQLYASSVRKLEVNLLKLYLTNAIQSNRAEKVTEFFEKYASELQSQPDWKEWFILPFIKNPEEQTLFAMYFTKQWQDTFYLSLHNFLSVIIQSIPSPSLIRFEDDQKKMAKLREENSRYHQQIQQLIEKQAKTPDVEDPLAGLSLSNEHLSSVPGPCSMDLMDDFFVISQDSTIPDQPQQMPKSQQIKSFIKNIGLPSSPILSKRSPQANSAPKASTSNAQSFVKRDETSHNSGSEAAASSSVVLRSKSRESQSHATRLGKARAIESSSIVSSAVVSYGQTSGIPQVPQSCENQPEKPRTQSESRTKDIKTQDSSDVQKQKSAPGSQQQLTHDQSLMQAQVPTTDSPFLLLSQEEYGEHHSSISHCCYSNSGHMVATADVDGVVKVWTLQPSPVTLATTMSKSMILSMEWVCTSDKWLLLGTKAGSIKLFDVKEKKTMKEVNTDVSYPRIISLSSSPNGASFVCSAAGKIRPGGPSDPSGPRMGKLTIWDLKTMAQLKSLSLSPGPIALNCTAYNHNGSLLLTGAADGAIRVFDIQKCECIANWASHKGEVYSLRFSPDETSCYSMGSDGKFLQWNLYKTGRLLAQLPIHSGACGPFVLTGAAGYRQVQTPKGNLFAFDPEGKHVLSCDQTGGMIYQLDKETGLKRTVALGGHKTPVVCVDWSSATDCKMCLTCSMDGKIRVSTLLNH